MRYTVGFFFSNKYDATKKNPWGGNSGIIYNLINDINVPHGTRGSTIHGIIKKVLLEKADGVKLEPNLKGRSKTGRKSIIDMDSQ